MCLNKFCQRLSQLVRRTFYFLSTLVAGRFWPLLGSVGRLVDLSVCLSVVGFVGYSWAGPLAAPCGALAAVSVSADNVARGFCFCSSLSLSVFLSLSVVLMQQISVGLKLYVPRSLCRGCRRFSCPFTHFCLFALAFFGIIEVQLS